MNILIEGFGSIGQRHFRNIVSIYPNANMYILRRKNNQIFLNNDNQLIKKHNHKFQVINKKKELKNTNIDASFICNPTSMHNKTILEHLKFSDNIFVEKPLSTSLSELKKIQKILKYNKNKKIMIGFHLRFNKCLKYIKKLLNKKEIGNICSCEITIAERITNFHPYESYIGSYAAKKKLDGGVTLTQSHAMDFALYLFGKPIKVYSVGGHLSNLEIDVEDTSHSVVTFLNESKKKFPVTILLDYIQNPPDRRCIIVGDKGQIKWDYFSNSVEHIKYTGKKNLVKFPIKHRNDYFVDEIKYFFSKIKSKKKIEPNFLDAKENLFFCLDLLKSQKREREIKVKW